MSLFRKPKPTPAQNVGATFGPWADHEQRCQCSVCR